MRKVNYASMSDSDIEERYFYARDGNYFRKQELPSLLNEMNKRGMII